LFENYRDGQQNPNQAKYQQREQSHQEYRHSYTSLLLEFSRLIAGARCDRSHLWM